MVLVLVVMGQFMARVEILGDMEIGMLGMGVTHLTLHITSTTISNHLSISTSLEMDTTTHRTLTSMTITATSRTTTNRTTHRGRTISSQVTKTTTTLRASHNSHTQVNTIQILLHSNVSTCT